MEGLVVDAFVAERDVQRLTEASVGVVVDSRSVKAADTVPKAKHSLRRVVTP